jgi:thiamine pyrophosphokinase
MSKCFIVVSYLEGSLEELIDFQEGDAIISADGGYHKVLEIGLTPDLIIGDLDSMTLPLPEGIELCRLPVEKDDTDTLAALKKAIELGFRQVILVGGLGGRLDHTIANLHCLSYALFAGVQLEIRDDKNRAFLFEPSVVRIPRVPNHYLSLFSYTETCRGVTTQGLYYPLSGATLTHSYPLGVSNHFTEEEAVISFTSGKLLVIISQDKG